VGFWDDYLRDPPLEVNFSADLRHNPEDSHCVRWRGYEGGFEIDELWQFGRGMRGIGKMPPAIGFTKYGGETLCGTRIESGQKMYGPRWRSIEPDSYRSERPDEDNLHTVLIDLYGITCMVCRNRLMYGVSRLIEDLTFIRSTLVGDWLGEEYISREPLVHGKYVISSEHNGNIHSETYRYRCQKARESINPQLVDDAKEVGRITCQDCLANLTAEVIP
jgi:hypothetical protein